MAKYAKLHRSGGDPVQFRLRDTEAFSTLLIEFQEAFTGGRAKQIIVVDEDGKERNVLINGRQVLAVELLND